MGRHAADVSRCMQCSCPLTALEIRLEQVAVDDWKRVENIEMLGCHGPDKFKTI